MGIFTTLTRTPFYIKSPEGSFLFLRGEDFSGFFPEPFPGAITVAAAIITAIITATTTATAILIIITITTTAIGGTLIRVKAFPFGKTFYKISTSISL